MAQFSYFEVFIHFDACDSIPFNSRKANIQEKPIPNTKYRLDRLLPFVVYLWGHNYRVFEKDSKTFIKFRGHDIQISIDKITKEF